MSIRTVAGAFILVVIYGLIIHISEWRRTRSLWRVIQVSDVDQLHWLTAQDLMVEAHFRVAIHLCLLVPAFTMNWLPAAPVPIGWLIVNRSAMVLIAILSTWKGLRLKRDRERLIDVINRQRLAHKTEPLGGPIV